MSALKFGKFIGAFFVLIVLAQLSSAVVVNSVFSDSFTPGTEGSVRIELKNNLDDDADFVTLSLNFEDLPFIPVGTSEQSVETIENDDEEDFVFVLKASNTIVPGDYEIPYTLSYEIDGDGFDKSGSIGLTVEANPDLVFSLSTTTPVLNKQGQISFKVVNKGFSDARFVSVKVFPDGYSLLSDDSVYIGTVDSDDFETANFDVLFDEEFPVFVVSVEYTDFNNKKLVRNVVLPVTVYDEEEAIRLGISSKNNTMLYVGIVVLLVLIFIIWRAFRKRRRMRRSERGG